jgi:hypothetical protein
MYIDDDSETSSRIVVPFHLRADAAASSATDPFVSRPVAHIPEADQASASALVHQAQQERSFPALRAPECPFAW